MMKKRNILYIGIALMLTGCASDENMSDTLSGSGKTPLLLETSLNSQCLVTRAVNGSFADDDQLLVYISHTTGGEKGTYTTVVTDQAPKLVTFKASVPPVLYWDDFSNSSAETTDLRTEGHALQTYYGYCYNGGAPTTTLEETTGKLGWTISKEQTSAEVVQHADLLWSAEQAAVTYKHAKTQLGKLTVPFTHARSEVTVTIKTDKTFGTTPMKETQLMLNQMLTVSEVNAPEGTITSTTAANIQMYGEPYKSGATRTFTAIVAPGTPLNVGDKLLNIVDVEGNNYTLTITDDMLKATAWAKEGYDANQTAIATQSGVNYHLDVNVSKTAITVEASLKDWTTVTAEGNGDIAFEHDIVNVTVEDAGEAFKDGASFRLFWKKASSTNEYALATTSTLNSGEWTNSPAIYWPNGTDQFFFRALSGNENNLEVKQNEDVLWGTTAKHNNIDAGAAIAPRTGNVPLIFEHAMTKVVFKLETTTGADAVDFEKATIAVSNLITAGTINMEDGAITGITSATDAISRLGKDETVIVLPQTITNDAFITVTLADGTKYKLQLNLCEDKDNAGITTWVRGKSYTYTITLKKEEIQFRALVKDWIEETGSGNATLDWD